MNMDPEYERKLGTCGIKKSHVVRIIVKETSKEFLHKGGNTLLQVEKKGFYSMRSVLRLIYERLPQYRGKRIWVEITNKSNGMCTICNSHYCPVNRIPQTL